MNVPNPVSPINSALVTIPSYLMPRCLQAIGRLFSASIDTPIAHLEQKKALIEARTRSRVAVEEAIGNSVANRVQSDIQILERAEQIFFKRSFASKRIVKL